MIIGAGPGGYEAALYAAGKCGMKTALVEKDEIGGTCLNRGCIPTKTLLHSAELFRQMRECGQFGLQAEGVSFDMGKIQERKTEVVSQLQAGILQLMKQKKVEVLRGTGTILDAHTVEVRGQEASGEPLCLDTEYILIATGSEVSLPPIPGIQLPGVMSSDGLLEKKDGIFPRLLIIGGGVIGVEFASLYSALGAEVTIVEALPRIIANLDKELSQSLKMLLKKRGVDIHTDAKVEEICTGQDGAALECRFSEKGKETCLPADGILVCTGRKPYTRDLFGPSFSLKMERGFLCTDEVGRTSEPNIYAIGDVTGKAMLAHAATAMGRNAAAHMAGKELPVSLAVIPSCIYTEPEIACTGLTLDEAKEHPGFAEGIKLLFISYGSFEIDRPIFGIEEGTDPRQETQDLKDWGVNAYYYISPGTHHEWLSWRRSLYQFAQLIFRQSEDIKQ